MPCSALIEDPKFRKHVVAYAKDNALFERDFAKAVGKLFALGTTNLHAVSLAAPAASTAAASKSSAFGLALDAKGEGLGLAAGASLAVALAVAARRGERIVEACILYEGKEVCGPLDESRLMGAEDETCVYDGTAWVCA